MLTTKVKKWIITISILIIILLAWLILWANPFSSKPIAINLYNATSKDIYIYSMQSTYGEEPSIEEVSQLKRVKLIKPHEKLTLPISTQYPEESEFSIGWKIGSRIARGGAVRTLINKKEGDCIIEIKIDEYSIKVDKPKTNNQRCSQKIKIFQETIDPEESYDNIGKT